MVRFHLGVDYGTSASKLVLRNFDAAGGAEAYLIEHDGHFRYSSAISFSESEVLFNASDVGDSSFKSLKMRFAEDVTGDLGELFCGERKPIPHDFSSEDLVTLSVWRLISIGHLEAVKISNDDPFKMGMTLGVPMSFLDNADLQAAFLKIAQLAYRIYRNVGPIGVNKLDVDLAKEVLEVERRELANWPEVDPLNVRNWIRSETEASMLWSFRSPAVPVGQFFCVDIGAGTTDSNAFQINQIHDGNRWQRDSLCFFGANTSPYGVDALSLLEPDTMPVGYGSIRNGLEKAARNAFAQIRGNINAVEQWRTPRLILVGGGALNQELCTSLMPHPMINWQDEVLEHIELSVPDDLKRTDGSNVQESDVVFTSVAYGLAE